MPLMALAHVARDNAHRTRQEQNCRYASCCERNGCFVCVRAADVSRCDRAGDCDIARGVVEHRHHIT